MWAKSRKQRKRKEAQTQSGWAGSTGGPGGREHSQERSRDPARETVGSVNDSALFVIVERKEGKRMQNSGGFRQRSIMMSSEDHTVKGDAVGKWSARNRIRCRKLKATLEM